MLSFCGSAFLLHVVGIVTSVVNADAGCAIRCLQLGGARFAIREVLTFWIGVSSSRIGSGTNNDIYVDTAHQASCPHPIDCRATTTCHNLPELTTACCGEMVVVGCGELGQAYHNVPQKRAPSCGELWHPQLIHDLLQFGSIQFDIGIDFNIIDCE